MEIVPITLREANDFVESFHRHNGRTSRDGGKFAIGVETDELVGVAIVGNPLSATFMDGKTAEVLRVCTSDHAPQNACSKLYGACWRIWRMMGGEKTHHLYACDREWRKFARCGVEGGGGGEAA